VSEKRKERRKEKKKPKEKKNQNKRTKRRITAGSDAGHEFSRQGVGIDEADGLAVLKIDAGQGPAILDSAFGKIRGWRRGADARVSPFGLANSVSRQAPLSRTGASSPDATPFSELSYNRRSDKTGKFPGGPARNLERRVIGLNCADSPPARRQ